MKTRWMLVSALFIGLAWSAPARAQEEQPREVKTDPYQPKLKKGVAKNVGGFMNFLKIFQELAGSVKTITRGAAKGVDGGMGELIRVALDGLLLKGIPNPDIREIISTAIGAIASQLSKPGFSLVQGVMAVLRALAADPALGNLIASTVKIPELQPVIRQGVKSLLTKLASETGVRSVMSNPLGFLTEIGVKLIDDVKDAVADALVKVVKAEPANRASLKTNLLRAINALKVAIKAKSFSELLNFGKALAVIVVKAIYDEFVSLLRKNAPAAKAKLAELVAKLPIPEVQGIARGVIDAIGDGASKFTDDAAACGGAIASIDLSSAKALFRCLGLALRQGAETVAAGVTQGAAAPEATEAAAGSEAAEGDAPPEGDAPAEGAAPAAGGETAAGSEAGAGSEAAAGSEAEAGSEAAAGSEAEAGSEAAAASEAAEGDAPAEGSEAAAASEAAEGDAPAEGSEAAEGGAAEGN